MTPAKYMFAYEEIKNLQVDLSSFAGSGATSAPHFCQPWVAPDAARPGLLLQGVEVEDDIVSVVGHRGSQPRQTAYPEQSSINSQE